MTSPVEAGPGLITSLEEARWAIQRCTNCSLHACATQPVFGEGPQTARLMLVGEQPGDREDLTGRPFTGPAGRLLDDICTEAKLDRGNWYVTNAVKHFKFEPRGKRRLHKRPNAGEIQACRWWLDLEMSLVKPTLVVALGATAAYALTGDGSSITSRRGTIEHTEAGWPVLITMHPAAILRERDTALARDLRQAMKEDLAMADTSIRSCEPDVGTGARNPGDFR